VVALGSQIEIVFVSKDAFFCHSNIVFVLVLVDCVTYIHVPFAAESAHLRCSQELPLN
jgi:hypothetical protein